MPFRLASLLLFGAALSFAQGVIGSIEGPVQQQQPNPNLKRYTVTGTVYNTITSEPIGRALVHLNGTEQHVAFTGADGRFEIQNVPEGQLWITAQRPGFFAPNENRGGSSFKLGSGSSDFRVPLTPESKITGTVLDSEGEPVEGIQVQALGAQIMDGRKQWMPDGGTSTDENGEYNLEGRMPGSVIVCTGSRPLMYARNSVETYPARCYPNATDTTSAQEIQIVAGQPAQVDFTIDAVRAYRVSGTIVGGDGNIAGWVEGPSGMPGVGVRINPRTHRFDLGPVPNGSWKVHFQRMNNPSNFEQTEEEITVNGADVTGLQVTLSPGIDIPIEIIQAASTANEQTAGQPIVANNTGLPVVRLHRPGENMFTGYVPMAVPDPNTAAGAPPRQIVKGVSPGTYKVSVQPSGGCLASVVSGGLDLLEQPLTVSAGSAPQPIVVTERSDCASLEVTLHSDHPDNEATLLLVPESPGLEANVIGISGPSFSFGQLTPGTYHVYAVSDASDLEYANPDAMRDISGQTVTLDANQKATVNLSVTERKK